MKSRQSYILLIFFLFSSFVSFGQSVEDYQRGYRNGFKDGYCKGVSQCTSPYMSTSSIPSPAVDDRNYASGYARGNQDGSKRKTLKNAKNESESRPCPEGIVIEKLIQRVYKSDFDKNTFGTDGSFENKYYSNRVTIDVLLGQSGNSILFNVKIKDMEVCFDGNSKILLKFRDGSKTEVMHESYNNCDGETILFLGNIFGKQSFILLEELNKKELEYIRISNDLFSFEYGDISSTEVYLSKFEALQILYTINCLSSNLN